MRSKNFSSYKKQNEGRYTTLYDFTDLSLLEKLYFFVSPTTIVLRRLLKILKNYTNKNKRKYKILDLGCGGGIKDLAMMGEVWGIDISKTSIKNAERIYKKTFVGDLTRKLPFSSNFFDIVFCSEVYGHIELKDKEKFLSEAHRVLKPNGLYVFSCETKGENWLTKYLVRTKKYQKLWIEFDGHVGLETPSKTISRFKHKFKTVNYSVNNSFIFTIDELLTVFPKLNKIFFNSSMRRIANLILVPVYWISINYCPLSWVNNILVYGKK